MDKFPNSLIMHMRQIRNIFLGEPLPFNVINNYGLPEEKDVVMISNFDSFFENYLDIAKKTEISIFYLMDTYTVLTSIYILSDLYLAYFGWKFFIDVLFMKKAMFAISDPTPVTEMISMLYNTVIERDETGEKFKHQNIFSINFPKFAINDIKNVVYNNTIKIKLKQIKCVCKNELYGLSGLFLKGEGFYHKIADGFFPYDNMRVQFTTIENFHVTFYNDSSFDLIKGYVIKLFQQSDVNFINEMEEMLIYYGNWVMILTLIIYYSKTNAPDKSIFYGFIKPYFDHIITERDVKRESFEDMDTNLLDKKPVFFTTIIMYRIHLFNIYFSGTRDEDIRQYIEKLNEYISQSNQIEAEEEHPTAIYNEIKTQILIIQYNIIKNSLTNFINNIRQKILSEHLKLENDRKLIEIIKKKNRKR